MKIICTLALALAIVATVIQLNVASAEPVVLFPYFDSNGENGVYLAWSEDGRDFHQVNGGKPIFTPPPWKDQNLTRDPSIVFQDGKFHMVWTSNWNGPFFGYAASDDLKTWSEPMRIRPFPEGTEQPKNVWAPELFWDHVAGNFKIVWSSTLPSELSDGDDSEDSHGYDHRMYYVETRDFKRFSEPKLLFQDLDYSVIDAQIVFDPGESDALDQERWVMVLKKEVPPERGGKNIRLAFSSPTIEAVSFRQPTEPTVGFGTDIQGQHLAEGPSLIFWNGEWLLYWDSYQAHHYSMASSTDLSMWTDQTQELKFPVKHPRHGTVFIADNQEISFDLENSPTE